MSNRLNLPEIGEPLNIDSFSSKQKESLLWYYDLSPASVAMSGAQGLLSVFFLPCVMLLLLILTLSPVSVLDDAGKLFIILTAVAVIVLDPLIVFGIAYLSPLYRRTYIMTDKRIVIVSAKNQISYVAYEEISKADLKINPVLRSRGKVVLSSKTVHTDNPITNALKMHFYGRKEDCEKVYSIAHAQIAARQTSAD